MDSIASGIIMVMITNTELTSVILSCVSNDIMISSSILPICHLCCTDFVKPETIRHSISDPNAITVHISETGKLKILFKCCTVGLTWYLWLQAFHVLLHLDLEFYRIEVYTYILRVFPGIPSLEPKTFHSWSKGHSPCQNTEKSQFSWHENPSSYEQFDIVKLLTTLDYVTLQHL